MKKIFKKFLRLIGKFLQLLDKIFVMPVMKLIVRFRKNFNFNNKKFDQIISSKTSLIVISLLIAFLGFYMIDKNSSIALSNYAEYLYGQSVTAIYNEEAYVVEGLPKTVDVLLIGKSSNIFLAKQYPNQGISVDLRELGVGTHKVQLKYKQNFNFVEYKVDPSTVTVVINDKVSSVREISYEILHRDNLDKKIDIASVKLSKSEVTIKGSEKTLNEVAFVKALVDVDNIVNPSVGTTSVKGVKLVAYNDKGNIVDVEILPGSIEAEIKLVSSSKSVPIKIIPQGDLAVGYAIGAITPNSNAVILYGDEELLKDIEFVPVYIDVNNLNSNKTYNVNLEKPVGVRNMSLKTVTIKLEVSEVKQTEIELDNIIRLNLSSEFNANLVREEKIVVIVKGSAEAIKNLDKDKISASVDLSKITSPGEYEVDVIISGDNVKLSYTSKTKKIKIKITKNTN